MASNNSEQTLRTLIEMTSTSNLLDVAGAVINNYTADLSSVSFVGVAPVPAKDAAPQWTLVYGENKTEDGQAILSGVPAKVTKNIHDALMRAYIWSFLSTTSRPRDDRGTAYIGWLARYGATLLELLGDRVLIAHFPKASLSTQEVLLSEAVQIAQMRWTAIETSKQKYGVSKQVVVRKKEGEPESLADYVIV